MQLTMQEGGANDADNTTNGVLVDPGGVATDAPPECEKPCTSPTVKSFDSDGGCSISSVDVEAGKRADIWLLAGFLAWMGWRRKSRQHSAGSDS